MKKALRAGSDNSCEKLKKAVIRVYPARLPLVCSQSRLSDLKHLANSLNRQHKDSIISSRLIENRRYYLSLLIKTAEAPRMLCDICENSDRVYIGYDYDAVFSEHGRVVIPCDAISALGQK